MNFIVLSVGHSFMSKVALPEANERQAIKLGSTFRIINISETDVTILSTETTFKAQQPITLKVSDAIAIITGNQSSSGVVNKFIIVTNSATSELLYITDINTISGFSDDYTPHLIEVDNHGLITSDEYNPENVGKLFYKCYDRFKWVDS